MRLGPIWKYAVGIVRFGLFSCFLLLFSIDGFAQQESKKENAREARANVREGNNAFDEGNFSGAEVAYRKALSKKENYAKAKYNLGNALYKQKRGKEALEQYETLSSVFKNKKEKAHVLHNLGNTYAQEKDYEKAVGAYKESLINNPTDEETRYNLALTQKLLKMQQQQQQQQQNQDKKNDQEKKEDQQKQNQQKNKNQDQKEDQQNQDQQKKENQKNQEQKESSDKEKNKQQQKPKEGKLSKEQLEQLLEALSNEESKTQKKVNEKKSQGTTNKREKDW